MLEPGALLAVLLAVASVAVLAGGRMAERTRRVGLLKAAGSTPGLVAAVLVAENLALALLAAAAGLVIGWAAAPLITNPGAGLIGTAGPPSITLATIGLTVALALAVALASTLVPAVKAARSSTVSALADSPRPPRRRAALIALSARLPVPLLLGIRMAAGRCGVPCSARLSAMPGALLGIPLGLGLFLAADGGGVLTIPPVWWLAAVVLAILAAVAVMASIPALIGARIPAAQILQSETA